MTFDPIVPLLMGLLIGLLVILIADSWWNARTHPHHMSWLTTHDWLLGGLLTLAVFAMGVFLTYVLLK